MFMDVVPISRAASGRWTKPNADAAAELSNAANPLHAFLRPAWYRASHPDVTFEGFESDGRLTAVFPLVARKIGPVPVREIAGPYWPFRSIPLALGASGEEIAAMLSGAAARRALGKAWRIGPVQSNDPSVVRLSPHFEEAGWTVFKRPISYSYDIDVAALQAKKPWPSKSAVRQSRNFANRLSRIGEVSYRHATGEDWTPADRDAMAAIEAASWLASIGDVADTKFLDPARRKMWEAMADDPVIAPLMFCSIIYVGETPAAFTFGLEVGRIRYQIANNFSERFKEASPGRIILTRDFADAAERGVPQINWGAGDAGYKARYGAKPGPEIFDLLILDRSWRPQLAATILRRRGWQLHRHNQV